MQSVQRIPWKQPSGHQTVVASFAGSGQRAQKLVAFYFPKAARGHEEILFCAGTVTIFNVAATATPFKLAEQFAMYGDVKDVREDPQIQGCWLVEYYDTRHAATAYKASSRGSSMHGTLPVVSETAASQPPQQSLRNVQSSHVLHNDYGSSNQLHQGDEAWQGPRSWDNQTGAAFQEQLASLMLQRNGRSLSGSCSP